MSTGTNDVNEHRAHLGSFPTPVERVTVAGTPLWIKRDDDSSALYGGNKVRKLEHLLGAARAEGKRRILTLGAAGSHQVVATAIYGKREGFVVEAVLVPQPSSDHARDNLRVAIAEGLVPVVASSWPSAPARVATRLGADAYFVPLGGSSALGSLGFVSAARELADQISAGLLPEPDVIVVAMGSGGTAAGLAAGLEWVGLRSRIVAVAISQPVSVLSVMARRLAKKTAERIGLSRAAVRRAVDRIEVDRRWVGRGYGIATNEGAHAARDAARAGIVLDATYTAKAFACALDRVRGRPDQNVLFWHTLSTAPMTALLERSPPLPLDLERLFR